MLADDDRAALPGSNIFRNQQNAPGKEFLPDIQSDFVADPSLTIVDLACSRVRGC
jgi:hypothetical protein